MQLFQMITSILGTGERGNLYLWFKEPWSQHIALGMIVACWETSPPTDKGGALIIPMASANFSINFAGWSPKNWPGVEIPVSFPWCVWEIPAFRQRKVLFLVPSTADFSCGRPAECKPPQGHPLTWQLPSPVCSPRWLMLSSRPLCCLLDTPSRLQTVCWARNSQQHTTVHAVLTPKLKFPHGSSCSFFWSEGLAPWWLKCTQSFFSCI